MKKLIALAMLFLSVIILHGQIIEVGQDVNDVINIIESSTNEHNSAGDIIATGTYRHWDIKYKDDQISEVLQCYSNEYLDGLGNISYYCKHYIIRDNRLAYTSTLFSDIDYKKVDKYFQDYFGEYKIGKYYFSSDYMYYSTIKVSGSGFVAVDWRKAVWEELSPELQDSINKKIKDQNTAEQIKFLEARRLKENKNRLKTYDLQVHDSARYSLFINELRESLIEGLKFYSKIPGWDQLNEKKSKGFIFKNTYNALYKINVQSNLSSSRYHLIPNVNSFWDENRFELVSGKDSTCDFLKYSSPSIPSLKKEGLHVMTDARVLDIDVFYTKGITHIKIKNGAVTYQKYTPPPEVQDSLTQDLKKLGDGLYEIKYEVGNVMGKSFINTEKEVMPTVGKKIAGTTMGIILIGILVMAERGE